MLNIAGIFEAKNSTGTDERVHLPITLEFRKNSP